MHSHVRVLWAALILFVSLAALPAWAAPYVWVTSEGGRVEAHVGELIPTRQSSPTPVLKEPQVVLADGKDLPVQATDDGYTATLPGSEVSGDARFTAKSLDKNDVLTIFGAKAGRSETKPVNDLELVPTEPNGDHFRLIWKGKPVASAVVGVQTSSGWRRTLHAGPDGTVSLVSPDFPDLFPSRYVLNTTVKLNGEVEFDGKTYDSVRYTATLTFDVPKQ